MTQIAALSAHEINTRTHAAVAAYHGKDSATATQLCSEILAAMPTHPYAMNLLAVMTMESGHLESAIDVFDQLLIAHPQSVQGKDNRGICEQQMRARGDYWLQMGFHYYQTGRMQQAVDIYRKAIAQGAGTDNIHGNLGAHLQELGDWEESERQYQQALVMNPAHVGTFYNLGHLLSLQHRHVPAKQYLERAIALKPDYAEAHLSLGHLLVQSGEIAEAFNCFDAAEKLAPQSPLAPSAKLFNLAYLSSTTAKEMYALAIRATSHIQYALPSIDALQGAINKGSQNKSVLKIGFVSGDFKDHPVAYFLENLLRHASRERFEWHVFSNYESKDAVSTRLRTLTTSWTNIAGQSDEAARTLIARTGIDILFDLSGHTALHRLPLFASRPASDTRPVQMTWLGWHDTTGLKNMDYLLTDRASMPPVAQENGSPYLTEKPLFLPRTRLCMMPPENAPPIAPQPFLNKSYITFGSMQILAKLSDVSLKLWTRILNEIPTARLAIRTKQFREIEMIERFKTKCVAYGLPMDRVDLLPPLGRGDYLASYEHIDILLDSSPYPGGTTTAEALWMGVPTITMGGNTMISRQGVSLLTAAGLEDWIAASEDDYVAKAIYWATHTAELQVLRSGLRAQVAQTALFDGAQFARDFESAMHEALNF